MQAGTQSWPYQSYPGGQFAQQGRGPAVFYGYCHDTGRMRMMDYPDYVKNVQTGYSNLVNGMTSTYQPYVDAFQGQGGAATGHHHHRHHHHDECGCCHEHHREEHDCHCSCCIRCADAVEYVRCGDVRQIPITLDNDTRREREVKLELGAFATDSGKELGWEAKLSETQFKLGPCGERTVVLTVRVDCSKFGTPAQGDQPRETPNVDRCRVAYATLRAEGCLICPLVIAVAVLPNDCGAFRADCLCGCCC